MPLSALKFHFFKNYLFFRRDYANTSPAHTHSVYRPIMSKKRALQLFLKITFFSSLLLLLTSETLPQRLFRQTSDQKWLKNRKNFFTFCYNFFHIFSLPLRKKQNNLLFPHFLSLEIEKPQGKTSHKNFFFLI